MEINALLDDKFQCNSYDETTGFQNALFLIKKFIDTLEVIDADLMIHTVITECCDWLAKNTNLSHDKIEDCRNLMLTVKEVQLKTQKGK